MHATTVAIDLAKDVFELAFADGGGRILERKRLSRRAFARALENRQPLAVVMEACGSAHHWARRFQAQGHAVRLLPARDVRPYVRRNKTDRADAAGLIEAARCSQIDAVPVKTPRQQGLQALHRVREQLKSQHTATINLVRPAARVQHRDPERRSEGRPGRACRARGGRQRRADDVAGDTRRPARTHRVVAVGHGGDRTPTR
jgi:transposase